MRSQQRNLSRGVDWNGSRPFFIPPHAAMGTADIALRGRDLTVCLTPRSPRQRTNGRAGAPCWTKMPRTLSATRLARRSTQMTAQGRDAGPRLARFLSAADMRFLPRNSTRRHGHRDQVCSCRLRPLRGCLFSNGKAAMPYRGGAWHWTTAQRFAIPAMNFDHEVSLRDAALFIRLLTGWNSQTLNTRSGPSFTAKRSAGRSGQHLLPVQGRAKRRWVIYNGRSEASRVAPEWHGWLHHTFKEPPTRDPLVHKPGNCRMRPNLTGTPEAYHPKGSLYLADPEETARLRRLAAE